MNGIWQAILTMLAIMGAGGSYHLYVEGMITAEANEVREELKESEIRRLKQRIFELKVKKDYDGLTPAEERVLERLETTLEELQKQNKEHS